jgi:hypothetical protein
MCTYELTRGIFHYITPLQFRAGQFKHACHARAMNLALHAYTYIYICKKIRVSACYIALAPACMMNYKMVPYCCNDRDSTNVKLVMNARVSDGIILQSDRFTSMGNGSVSKVLIPCSHRPQKSIGLPEATSQLEARTQSCTSRGHLHNCLMSSSSLEATLMSVFDRLVCKSYSMET